MPISLPPNVSGILIFTLGLSFIALADAMAKVLGESMPSPQVVWLYLVSVLVALFGYLFVTRQNFRQIAKTKKPGLQIARGLSILCSLTFIFGSLQFLPLAEATVINFTGPLFMVALAGPMLGEKVGWRRWAAVIVGLAGAMIVVRPGSEVFQWAALMPIASAVFFALFQLLTRKISVHDGTMTTLFYTQIVAASGAVLAAPFFWTPVTLYQLGFAFLAGCVGLAAHMCMFNAFRLADASLLAPINYTRIVASVLLGYWIFGDLPDFYTILGGAVIIGSGLFVIYRETRTKKAA